MNFRQIALSVRKQIEDGTYTPGQWLPAERVLAEEFGVHRRVIREAITQLSQDGLLICQPRCRPVIAPIPSVSQTSSGNERTQAGSHSADSRLIALLMWHGGFEPRTSAQQRIFWGFNRALGQADYHGVFLDLGETIEHEEENAIREAARLQYVLEHRFAGVVFYPYAYRSNRDLIREVARTIPMVMIDRQIPGIETDYVGIDNLSAMRDATNWLLTQGHRRIALVTRSEPINTVQERIIGYRTAMQTFDPPAPDLLITVDSEREWSVFDLIFGLPTNERPTALLCVNDVIALEVAERLEKSGIRVPEDVALIGFDDLVQVLPKGIGLSSVAQPFEELGAAAARLLVERLTAHATPIGHTELPAKLVIRDSSSTPVPDAVGADEVRLVS